MASVHPDPRIWDAQGIQKKIESLTQNLAAGKIKAALITGPPGSGKTWIARSIAAEFVNVCGGPALRAVGNEGEAHRSLYAFRLMQAETKGYFKPLAALGRAVANAVVGLVSGGDLDAQGALDALDAEAARRKRVSAFLGEEEQAILSDLAKEASNRPMLLIADNLHWWDEDSLNLLHTILVGDIAKAYPFVRKLRLLAVTTDDQYQMPIWKETFEGRILPIFRRRIETNYIKPAHLTKVAEGLGLPVNISSHDRSFIFDLSGGHLTILTLACKYIANHGGHITALTPLDRDRFIEDIFLERIRKIGSLGESAQEFLSAAAIIGGSALQTELECLLKATNFDVQATVDICRELEFIEQSNNRVEFRHDYIRRFFSKQLGAAELRMRATFAECLRKLTPGDYLRRAENLARAREPQRAAELYFVAAMSNLRNGRAFDHLIENDGVKLIRSQNYEKVLNSLVAAYECYARGQDEHATFLLDSVGPAYPRIMLAEIEQLRAQIDLTSRSGIRRKALVHRLHQWRDHLNDEFEQGIRLLFIMRSALSLEFDKAPARDLDGEITRLLIGRLSFDSLAESRIHALNRSAESLFLPDIALKRVEHAEFFHRPKVGQVPSEPAEYFRCLNNLTALCISCGEYERAIDFASQGVALATKFTNLTFPRQDMIQSMRLIASLRLGTITPELAVEKQDQISMNLGVESDPFYVQNYLGVFYCLSGNFVAGIAIFEKLRGRLLALEDPEPNPLYFVSSNLWSAKFLAGEKAVVCREAWVNIGALVDRIPYETRRLLQHRHDLMLDCFVEGRKFSSKEWDEYPLQAVTRPLHSCWKEIGRGFRLPDVQFWSMR